MKKLEKMSLANVRSKLTRKEMSNIMAGSSGAGGGCVDCGASCGGVRGGVCLWNTMSCPSRYSCV
jgi:hypothetical protein